LRYASPNLHILKQANLVEEERIMEIVTSWMEKGIEQGIEQGEQKIVKRQLKRRFNNIDSTLENRIDSLSVEQIENLADAIFDLQSLEDLINWLDQQN
jgi:phosphotransacetylase